MRWSSLLLLPGLTFSALFSLAAASAAEVNAAGTEDICQRALAGEHRADAHRARDVWRHPCATLAFFEVEPQHSVVEIWPGGGWYTEVLAPMLRERGTLYAAHWSADSPTEYFRKGRARFDAKLQADPDVYANVEMTVLEPPTELAVASRGSADRVVSFRNVHSWLRTGTADTILAAAYQALKPGGLLGIVQHRATPGTGLETMIETGYVTEAKVRALAESAGFEFAGSAEINANPADDHDHPKGVWTLPPSLRMGETDRQQYTAIGESDRMTMKFRKPE